MKLGRSVAAMLAMLAVPLLLALASQALATRPGPPVVSDIPIQLVDTGSVASSSTRPPASHPARGSCSPTHPR